MGLSLHSTFRESPNLKPFQTLLELLPGVEEREPIAIKGECAHAFFLHGSLRESKQTSPIIEFSQERFLVHVRWSDNRYGHTYYLTQQLLRHNKCVAKDSDGYAYPDNTAISKWLKHSSIKDVYNSPEHLKILTDRFLIGAEVQLDLNEDNSTGTMRLRDSLISFDLDDYLGPDEGSFQIEKATPGWTSTLCFETSQGPTLKIIPDADSWKLATMDGQLTLLGFPGGGLCNLKGDPSLAEENSNP